LFNYPNGDGIGDGNETRLGEGDRSLNHRLENTLLGQVGDGLGDTDNLGLNNSLRMIAG
jgi:hypothetical protein